MKTTLLTRLGVVVIGAGLILMNTVIPAQAKTTVQSRGIGMSHNISTTGKALNWWAGAFLTDKGLGFCLQPTRLLPKGTELDDIKPMTSFVNDQGDALTTAQLNQLAYLMWKATSTDLQYNIDAVGYKLAMMTLAGYNHVKVNDGNGKLSSTYYNFSLDDSASTATKIAEAYGVLDFARGLVAEARAKANNWDGTGTLKLGAAPQQPGDELTATVTLPGLGSGFPVVFSVTQPDGSVKDVTVDTKSDVATLTETIDQYGDYKVSAHLAHLAAPRYPMVALTMTNTQSLLMMAGDPRDWSSEESGTMTAPKPSISTQISDQIILPGETIHDTVLLEDLITNPHATYVVSGGLYALDPLADGTCP
ncbi:MAG: hypothetical protein FWD80_05085, partial [Propionibacteriaceae bacterium]|nr:hypothetical protein [Propionibacteriaceae bacterium]